MGAGNQNTDGNKKSNFSWQKNVLLSLGQIKTAILSLSPGGSGVARTVGSVSVGVGAGSVATGAKWINFIMSDDFTGTVNGATMIGAFSFMMPYMGNDTYQAIPYNVTAGTLRIDRSA